MASLKISNIQKEELKQIKSEINFKKVKSNYILQKIFKNLQNRKLLEIISIMIN